LTVGVAAVNAIGAALSSLGNDTRANVDMN
jgi:hypothetical protein